MRKVRTPAHALGVILILAFVLSVVPPAAAAPAAPMNTSYQSLPFSQNWSSTGLITANDDWSGVPGVVGYLGDYTSSSPTGVDPQTLLVDYTTVAVDVIANQTNPNTLSNGGVAEFDGIADPVVALNGSGTADAPYLLLYINTTGYSSIQVSYKLRDIDGSIDNAVQQVALHYRVGTTGNFTNVSAAYVADATTGPSLATLVTPINVTLPTAADNQAQVQLRIMTTNAVGNDEWVGVDDISITGTPIAGDAPPTVSSTVPADGATNVSLGSTITLNFSEEVDLADGAVTLECPAGTPTAFTSLIPVTNVSSVILTPSASLPVSTLCTVTAVAANITDRGANAYHLDGNKDGTPGDNYVFTFTTAAVDPCTQPATLISAIQGSGPTSPLSGSQTIQGIVVGDFQSTSQLSGFFVEEEAADWDADPLTSEGIFVYQGSSSITDLNVGDKVRLTGTVSEYADRTAGGGTLTELASPTILQVCGTGNPVTPVDVTLPETVDGDLERYEGMLIRLTSATVSQNYWLGRYGQMTLSGSGRLYGPTNQYRPNSVDALNLANLNARSQVILDDGKAGVRCGDNPNPVPYLGPPPLNVIRSGDTVTVVGVLDYGQVDSTATGASCSVGTTTFGGDFRIHPTQTPVFTAANPRPAAPDSVPGNVKVVGANVLNFFNGNGDGTGFPTSRGASTFTEFVRQRIKLYEELSRLNADVVTLSELENDGFGSTSAIAEMVKILNEGPCWNSATECTALSYSSSGMGAGTYTFIDLGGTVGTDEITVGIIYKPGKVTLVGTPQKLTDAGYTDPNSTGLQKSRPAVAASFEENTWGERFTVVANHLKSKGCSTETGLDIDQGDGQGCWNDTRQKGATYLINTWLPTDPTGAGDPDYLLMGDMNAYAQEDPIFNFENGGYTDQIRRYVGTTAYSYIFDGLSGYLDHALANAALHPQVLGTTHWHNNVDEPPVIDYNLEYNQVNGYYVPNQYRAADHDPVLVGLGLYPDQGDLASSYGTAWHTGQGVLRLGEAWTGESSSTPGSDNASDDGITRIAWASATSGKFRVAVSDSSGCTTNCGCLNAWMDFTDDSGTAPPAADGNFTWTSNPATYDSSGGISEYIIQNQVLDTGSTDVSFSVPEGVIPSSGISSYYFRFRLSPTVSGACPTAVAPTGFVSGGEVEDYQFSYGPTAITLASMSAAAQGDSILVTWETVSELGNAGFNLYRDTLAAGPGVKLNAALIPSQAPGSSSGFVYSYTDRADLVPGTTYTYWLEDVSQGGVATRHEPVSVTYGAPTAVSLASFDARAALPLALPLAGAGLAGLLGLAGLARRRRRVNV